MFGTELVAPRFTASNDTANPVVIEPTSSGASTGESVLIYGIMLSPTLANRNYTFSDNDGNKILEMQTGAPMSALPHPFLASNGFIIDALSAGYVIVYHGAGGA